MISLCIIVSACNKASNWNILFSFFGTWRFRQQHKDAKEIVKSVVAEVLGGLILMLIGYLLGR